MQLKDYARILWKRGWIIIVLAILAAGSAYVFSKLQTPIFKSTVTLSTVPSRPSDYGQTLAIKNLLRLYVQRMQSPILTQQVIDKLQLDVTPQKFASQIYFNADESTLTITLEARHPLPDVAAKMARTLAEVFVSYHNQENLQIDQRDRVLVNIINATSPEIFSPKTSINTLAGAVLGALLGLVIIFVLEWLESDIIRAAEDLERVIGVTVLGAIPTMAERASAPTTRAQTARPSKVCPHCGNPI